MRILIYKKNHVINSSGGAEKVMINLANKLSQNGHEVSFVTRDTSEGAPFFTLEKKVEFLRLQYRFSALRHIIGKGLNIFTLLEKFPYFDRKSEISTQAAALIKRIKPDVIIVTGIPDLVDLSYRKDYDIPLVLTLHSRPDVYFKSRTCKLYSKVLPKLSAAQVLLPSYVSNFSEFYKGRIEVISNIVELPPSTKNHLQCNNQIIYVARIEPNKQVHLLISAFIKIAAAYPEWKVNIYGSVSNKKYYHKCLRMIKDNLLEKRIIFKGTTKNPLSVLIDSDICAFPSRFEGWGLALTEAMSVGLPCVGLRSCSGVNELIKDDENGFLADDGADFAKKLSRLMEDSSLRRKFGENALQSVQAYTPDIVMQQWEKLLQELVLTATNH